MGFDARGESQNSVKSPSPMISPSLPAHEFSELPTEQPTPSGDTLADDRRTSWAPDEVQVDQRDPKKIISFSSTDPDNPYNWPKRKKTYVFYAGMIAVINSTLSSSLPSGAIDFIVKHFNVTAEIQRPLPISCFLAGYVVGPAICGPLSENYGRQRVILSFFSLATIFSMACAVAPNWPALLFFRFVCGVGFSGPIAITGGLYADVYDDPRERGLATAWFMVATSGGPVVAPVISGFIAENTTWRWVFAVGTLLAAATLPLIIAMPETFTPVLLSRKARRLRQATGDPEIIAKSDLEQKTFRHVVTVVMTRPFRMLFQEVIVMCAAAYCSFAYAIFYLYFEAYPIIFQGPKSVYHWSYGVSGLAFIPIGIGGILAAPIYLWWDSYVTKARKRKAKWAQQEEFRRLPLACIGGPLYVVSLFWIGWSAKPGTLWLAPVASGVIFGMGFLLIFIALLNYLTDAYETFAASAQGITSTCRSVFGALLPLATHRMFSTLGIAWACSLLGFVSLGMCVIPFTFIKFGDRIRDSSKFCKELKALKAQETAEREEAEKEEGITHPGTTHTGTRGNGVMAPRGNQEEEEEKVFDRV